MVLHMDRAISLTYRIAPVIAVFVMAMVAIEMGVDVSARPGLPQSSWAAQVYYATGLFVLGGLDLGTPVGGPLWARLLLWIAYFLAPVITTTTVAEGLIRILRPQWVQRRRFRNHTVIVGLGNLGQLYADGVRAHCRSRTLVLVDLDAGLPGVAETKRRHRAHFVQGDIHRAATVDILNLSRAEGLVLATSNDLLNLEAAWDVRAAYPTLPIAVHVADLNLRHTAAALDSERVHVFNTHQMTAAYLFREHLAEHLDATDHRDVVIIAGFGRFGQTILEFLCEHAGDGVEKAILIDRQTEPLMHQFADQVGFGACEPVPIDGDVSSSSTWRRIKRAVPTSRVPLILLALDRDDLNLKAARVVRSHFPDAPLFVRSNQSSEFVHSVSHNLGFVELSVESVIGNALRDHYITMIS